MSVKGDSTMGTCTAHPYGDKNARCGLPAGHDGNHVNVARAMPMIDWTTAPGSPERRDSVRRAVAPRLNPGRRS